MDERPYITCRELIEFLHLYLDGELPPDRVTEFKRHLSVCDPCVKYIKTYEEAIALGRVAYRDWDAPAGDEVPEELVRAVLLARRGKT
jgi:anti-sigma factor RsiW